LQKVGNAGAALEYRVGKLEGLISKLTVGNEVLERDYITASVKLEEAGIIRRGRPLLNGICRGCRLNSGEQTKLSLM
jgi:hypothetical protein